MYRENYSTECPWNTFSLLKYLSHHLLQKRSPTEKIQVKSLSSPDKAKVPGLASALCARWRTWAPRCFTAQGTCQRCRRERGDARIESHTPHLPTLDAWSDNQTSKPHWHLGAIVPKSPDHENGHGDTHFHEMKAAAHLLKINTLKLIINMP